MKKLITPIVLVFIIMILITGCKQDNNQLTIPSISEANQLSQKEKLDDFEYMYDILQENFPFFEVNKRLNGIDWLGKKDEYMDLIKSTKSDDEFYASLNSILGELHNGHTNMLDEQEYFLHKRFFTLNSDSYSAWLQQLNIEKAINRYSQNDTGKEPGSTIGTTNSNIVTDNVRTEILVQDKAAYLYIKSLRYSNIEWDMKIIKPFLLSIKDYSKLIIDIRGNGGGSESYWTDNIVPMLISKPVSYKTYMAYRGGSFEEDFIKNKLGFGYEKLKPIIDIDAEGLKNYPPELKEDFKYYYMFENTINPKDSIDFEGKIYLLVDNGVYSSSEMFASFAKSTGFATLVGRRTGGDGIGQDPLVCVLPNSGYAFRFPMVMGLQSDGTCNNEFKTAPDIEMPTPRDENLMNDKAIQYILNSMQ